MTATDVEPLTTAGFSVLEEILELPETPCEFKHSKSKCTFTVKWSASPLLCGCIPHRRLACQGAYEFMANSESDTLKCTRCGHEAPKADWLKGWVAV